MDEIIEIDEEGRVTSTGKLDFRLADTPENRQALADKFFAEVPELVHVGTWPPWRCACIVFENYTIVPKEPGDPA